MASTGSRSCDELHPHIDMCTPLIRSTSLREGTHAVAVWTLATLPTGSVARARMDSACDPLTRAVKVPAASVGAGSPLIVTVARLVVRPDTASGSSPTATSTGANSSSGGWVSTVNVQRRSTSGNSNEGCWVTASTWGPSARPSNGTLTEPSPPKPACSGWPSRATVAWASRSGVSVRSTPEVSAKSGPPITAPSVSPSSLSDGASEAASSHPQASPAGRPAKPEAMLSTTAASTEMTT